MSASAVQQQQQKEQDERDPTELVDYHLLHDKLDLFEAHLTASETLAK